ncbi:hypothetical protein NUW58_g10758 [Xylaria curta]|uniref:Uncharacterized protein n=1 Tax=Xylaria curta TaxID=42375 RepID=A0ACC1MHC4_9PEZI|nr:hypothetical protein NUW58_g10758 [Xylaria curta]
MRQFCDLVLRVLMVTPLAHVHFHLTSRAFGSLLWSSLDLFDVPHHPDVALALSALDHAEPDPLVERDDLAVLASDANVLAFAEVLAAALHARHEAVDQLTTPLYAWSQSSIT